ncbi:pseudouridylate synthase 7 homolog [Vanessa cardui]|uniref:pseudouridylate synthase 7 homolog n=1 Tax=Vanessa cardui TaxID=171605 RepID=UPI001F1334F4|nr:pseudouridylate synthase 7 homolog [Vanessa cardui]
MNNNWNRNQMRGGNNRGRGHGRGRGPGGFWPQRGFRGSNWRGFNRGGPRQNFDGRKFNQQWMQKTKRDGPSKRLSEQDIGVTEYLSDHEGFNGIIKSRFSDFQVSEINEKGEIAKLTDLSAPQPPIDEDVVDDEDLILNKYNLEILPMETWDNINKLAISPEKLEPVKVDVTGMSKEERTKIHDAVKKAFGESIVGSTVTENDKKFVVFEKYRKGVRIDNRVKWVWPGEYVRFIVYKENCDTMEAAQRIADRLRLNIKPSMVGYAGTKDRRAKTSQWFSLRKVDPRKIVNACKDLREIRVGNFSFSNDNLKLGMLQGNVFRICLRNVTASDECIDKACTLLQKNGFINYYGLQRFGSRIDMPTYEIGKKLLQGNFQEAIECMLSECEDVLAAYRAEGARAALARVSRNGGNEARVLRALALRPHDLLGALDKVARNARLLYIHSYQSLVWNRVVSERLRRAGRSAAVGDLVPAHGHADEAIEEESDNDDSQTDLQTDEPSEDTATPTNDTPKPAEQTDAPAKKLIPVKVLTQEDIDSGKYTIFDIVLPLPGYSVEYPPNMVDYYKELLEKDGLNLDMKHKYKSYSMCGGYRRCALRPRALEWRRAHYAHHAHDLLLSDRDLLDGRSAPADDGKYKALLLTMTLPTSCYATMALRELLRVDTSSDNQALQNNYHEDGNDKNGKDNKDVEANENVSSGEKRKIDDDKDLDEDLVKKTKQNDDE